MLNGKKVLGVVPARGGSKGIPRKNLSKVGNVPLVGFAIVAAKLVAEIDRIILSTDDIEIAEVGRLFGAEIPFMRPQQLAADDTPMIEVLVNILERMESEGESYDYLCLLQPTTPFRNPASISKGLHILDEHPEADCCLALSPVVDYHPKRIRRIVNGYVEGYLGQGADQERQQRQSHQGDPAYRRCGTFYISRKETILKGKSIFGKRSLPFICDGSQAITIDEPLDLLLAEAVWANRDTFPELEILSKALMHKMTGV